MTERLCCAAFRCPSSAASSRPCSVRPAAAKTTTLRIIGGFEQPDSGDVLFDGKRMNDVPPYQREINTVFQRYALFPHLNVYGEYRIRSAHRKSWTDADIKRETAEMLELVGLQRL